MPWTEKDYPQSMKNLDPKVRAKAIEIANAILEEDKMQDEGRAIAIATAKAEEWAKDHPNEGPKTDTSKTRKSSSDKSKS